MIDWLIDWQHWFLLHSPNNNKKNSSPVVEWSLLCTVRLTHLLTWFSIIYGSTCTIGKTKSWEHLVSCSQCPTKQKMSLIQIVVLFFLMSPQQWLFWMLNIHQSATCLFFGCFTNFPTFVASKTFLYSKIF